ncbi:MAG: hypothetical protein HQM12_22765 [SAR324 cluster bacterium]|nr:hypothetical protein [SAR324 cluster bacterium]
MREAIKKLILAGFTCGLIVSCQPPQDQDQEQLNVADVPQQDQTINFDKALTSEDSSLRLADTVKPDLIFIEGFSNGFMNTNSFYTLMAPLNSMLELFGTSVQELLSSVAGLDTSSQPAYAKWYFSKYADAFIAQGKVNKVGYLHWDTGYRILRNGAQLSQMEDNYNGNGAPGLHTRIQRMMNGTYTANDVKHFDAYCPGATETISEFGLTNVKKCNNIAYKLCTNGCIFMTHSTGGLVFDRLVYEANQEKLTAGTYPKLAGVWDKTTMAVEISSAGGGTEFSSTLINLVASACNGPSQTDQLVMFLVQALFPEYQCSQSGLTYNSQRAGAGTDLVPSVARDAQNGTKASFGRTPILHIAGNGNMMPDVGILRLDWIISNSYGGAGYGDGLVPLASTCGANTATPIKSCHPKVSPTGTIGTYSAPAGLYTNHHPFIMTGEGHLSEMNAIFEALGVDDSNWGTYVNPINYVEVALKSGNLEQKMEQSFSNSVVEVLVPPQGWGNPEVMRTQCWYENGYAGADTALHTNLDTSSNYGGMSNQVDDITWRGTNTRYDFWDCGGNKTDWYYKISQMSLEGDGDRMFHLLSKKLDVRMQRGDTGQQNNMQVQ